MSGAFDEGGWGSWVMGAVVVCVNLLPALWAFVIEPYWLEPRAAARAVQRMRDAPDPE